MSGDYQVPAWFRCLALELPAPVYEYALSCYLAEKGDPDCIPENVECPDCQGRGWHTERQGRMSGQFTCLVCGGTGRVTPENVEEPT